MAIDTIKSSAVLDGAIATADIADDAVTGAKIENNPTIAGNLGVTGTSTLSGNTTMGGTLSVTGGITASTTMSAVGSFTHGSNTGDTRFILNGPNQYRSLYQHAGNIAGYIGGSGADVLRFSNAAGTTTLEANNGQFTYPLQPSAQSRPSGDITNVTGDASTYYSQQGNSGSGTTTYTDIFDRNLDMLNGTFTAPITGRYLACINVEFDGIANNHSSGVFYIITSNRNYQRLFRPDYMSNVGVNCGLPMTQIVDADANDVIRWALYIGGGSKTIDIKPNTNFGVHLLS
tara:strand:+ start:43 stop:906 length:864 start_codon:yes stop_codon:yes gene_type:complete